LIEFSVWFSLAAGLIGTALFSVMLFSLGLLRTLGQIFNETYSMKALEARFNRRFNIRMRNMMMAHPATSGSALAAVSLLLFLFFALGLDAARIAALCGAGSARALALAALQFVQWTALAAFGFCFVFGLLLAARKGLAEKLCDRFDAWYSIDEKIEDRLEKTITKDIDTISFLRQKTIGMAGLTISVILTLIALYDILFVV
jgi:hypothetical protein